MSTFDDDDGQDTIPVDGSTSTLGAIHQYLLVLQLRILHREQFDYLHQKHQQH
jgi:hypothetical protein